MKRTSSSTRRILQSLLMVFLFSGMAFGQSDKLMEREKKQAIEISNLIESQNENLALSEEQINKITAEYAKKFKDIRKLKKDGLSDELFKEKSKELHKATNQIVMKEILSKKQRGAYREAKKKEKNK